MEHLLVIIGIAIVFIAGLLVLEFASRKTRLPRALIRKAGHVGLALVIAVAAVYVGKDVFVPIGLGFAAVALLLRQLPLESLRTFKTTSYGEVLFPLGVGLAALITTSSDEFIIAMLILGLADTAAYVVGTHVRSPRMIGSKTVAGTLAFTVVAFAIICITTGSLWALVIAPLLASVELISRWGSDNITVPVATSLLLLIFV